MTKAKWIAENLGRDEHYAGIILGKGGNRDYHLVLLPGKVVGQPWDNCVAWAESVGGELPTLRELALLRANRDELLKPVWYWSCEQHASHPDVAWSQSSDNGTQFSNNKSFGGHARAVRRIYIDGAEHD